MGSSNSEIARQLQLHRYQVRLWRQRWHDAIEQLQAIEAEAKNKKALRNWIIELLTDAPRPGAPAKFSVEQIVQIVAVACELPASSGRPINHWSPTELADEVIKRKIVEEISPRSVGRILKSGCPATPSQPLLAQCQSN